MIKRIVYLGIVITLVGCKSNKDISGVYISDKYGRQGINELVLKEDNNIRGSLVDCSSEGLWRHTDNVLELNSNSSLQPGIIEVVEKFDKSSDSIYIKITTEEGYPLAFGSVIFNENNSLGIDLDENGKGINEYIELKDITIHYLASKYSYELESPNSKTFDITVRLERENNFFLEKELYIVKRRKLVDKTGYTLLRKEANLDGRGL